MVIGTYPEDLLFEATTPLGFRVRVTCRYWELITTVKHPAMLGCEAEIRDALENLTEIRVSRSDPDVYLFYAPRQMGRWVCAVTKRLNGDGFLVTAYPTDRVKEGHRVWRR